jgi:hypothetical protein
METTQGISLYNYLHLKVAKMLFLLLSFMFCLQQYQRTRRQNRLCKGWGEVVQIMYTHVSKCKSNKIKIKKNLRFSHK